VPIFTGACGVLCPVCDLGFVAYVSRWSFPLIKGCNKRSPLVCAVGYDSFAVVVSGGVGPSIPPGGEDV
jgi:hypothetical protein